jgi:hypothetical protein
MQNTHIVTRNFRGVALFLVSALNGFVWTTDRANAERFEHNTAVETARRASDWDRTLEPARAVDPDGQVIEPARGYLVHEQRPLPIKYRGYTIAPNGEAFAFRRHRADVWLYADTQDEARASIDEMEKARAS